MAALLKGTPSDADVKTAVAAIEADKERFSAFTDLSPLGGLKREDLRPFFRSQLKSGDVERQAQALAALGSLPKTDEDVKYAQTVLVDKKAPYPTLASAAVAMAKWDPATGVPQLVGLTKKENPRRIRRVALEAIGQADSKDPRLTEALIAAMKSDDWQTSITAVEAVKARKDKALIPDIEALAKNLPAGYPGWYSGYLSESVNDLKKD